MIPGTDKYTSKPVSTVEIEVVQAEQMTVQRISDEELKRYDVDWITYDSEGDELPFQV